MRPDMLYGTKCCAMKKHVDQISVTRQCLGGWAVKLEKKILEII